MTKEEANKVIRLLKMYYPYAFKKQTRQEIKEYVIMFYNEFLKYDLELMADALEYLKKREKYMPNFIKLGQYVGWAIQNRLSDILKLIREEKCLFEGLDNLTGRDKELAESRKYDAILVEIIMNRISEKTKKLYLENVDKYESLKDYRGKVFFLEGLPNPIGYDPDYNVDAVFRNKRPGPND